MPRSASIAQRLRSTGPARLAGVVLAFTLLAFSGCGSDSDTETADRASAPLPVLRIDRPEIAQDGLAIGEAQRSKNWQALAASGKPFLVRYPISANLTEDLWKKLNSPTGPVDPFTIVDADAAFPRFFPTFQNVLEKVGVTFPEGTWALYDWQRETLSLLQSEDQHELTQAYFDSIKYDPPFALHFHFDVIEVSTADAEFLLQSRSENERYQTARDWLASGRARLATAVSLPGQNGALTHSNSWRFTTAVTTGARGEAKLVGLTVEVDPVVNADGVSIDFKARLQTSSISAVDDASREKQKNAPFLLPAASRLKTETQIPIGQAHLLGVLAPPDDIAATEAEDPAPNAQVWLPFVRASFRDATLSAKPATKSSAFPADNPNPFAIRTHIYRIPPDEWNALGKLLYGNNALPTTFKTADYRAPLHRFTKHQQLTDLLTLFGFEFSATSQLIYNAETGDLIANLNAFEMNRLRSLFDFYAEESSPRRNVVLQLEIIELAAALCTEIGESAAAGADHTPEWLAVDRLVQMGDAEMVTALQAISHNAHSVRIEDVRETSLLSDYDSPPPIIDSGLDDYLLPFIDEFPVGTTFEFGPHFESDHRTIDVHLGFEHHTAPPSMISRPLQFPAAQGGRLAKVDVPVFYRHETTTLFVMSPDTSRIIAMWRPSGLPKYASKDLMQIAFVRASVSGGYQIERIR